MRWTDTRILIAGVASLLVYGALVPGSRYRRLSDSEPMLQAARIMSDAMKLVTARRTELRIPEDAVLDPNGTGLLGPEDSELLTTVGDLQAKRTVTNPNVAALIVHLLARAGVGRGETVAVASSGSFPALMLASIAAAQAIGARPVVILSLGASSYGATSARFSLLDIYDVLIRAKICPGPPAAVSLGGENDVGLDFEPGVRESLLREIQASGVPLIREPELAKNVARRAALYAASGRVAALINCGGSYSSLGTSASILQLKPGLVMPAEIPSVPPAERGLVQEMAARGIPVIHLLHIRGLALNYGLPWDPVPLPAPGNFNFPGQRREGSRFWVVSVAYLTLLCTLALWPAKRPREGTDFD